MADQRRTATHAVSAPFPVAGGTVASLHIHPAEPGAGLQAMEALTLVAGKGIAEDRRYFDRTSKHTGKPNRRQVSLIEREQIAEHAATLGLQSIAPGAVRANIETTRVDLHSLLGQDVEVGEVILRFHSPRTPCPKMDALCSGLRELMRNNRQGVLAEVVRSGTIRVGDLIRSRDAQAPEVEKLD